MLTQRTRFSKLSIPTAIFALLLGVALRGRTQEETALTQKVTPTRLIPLAVPNFQGLSDSEIIKLKEGVENQQELIRQTLLAQLQDGHLSPLARTETISMLGDFPDYKGILALIQNMNFISLPNIEDPTAFVGYIARHKLARLGSPAEMEILGIIGSARLTDAEMKNDPNLRASSFEPSKVDGFAGVLVQIEGKQHALLILQGAQTRAASRTIKAQFQAVINAVKKGETPAIKY